MRFFLTSLLLSFMLAVSPLHLEAETAREPKTENQETVSENDGSSIPNPTNLEGVGKKRAIVVNGKYYEMDNFGEVSPKVYLNDSVKTIEEKKEHPDYSQIALRIISPEITILPIIGSEGNIDENRIYALDVYQNVGTDLKTLYDWTASQIEYIREETYWALPDYGRQGFLEKKGNCLAYSAVFYYLASGLGYKARVVRGNVLSDSGKEHAHAWVLINERGKDYLYDPQGERELGDGNDFYHIELDQAPLQYVYPEGEEPLQNRILG